MSEPVNYDQPLRAIGQALEVLGVESFRVESQGDDYLVTVQVESTAAASANEAVQDSTLDHVWGRRAERAIADPATTAAPAKTLVNLELHYTRQDIDRLEQEGHARRKDPYGTPDAASLSQALRTVGAYLVKMRVRLIKISRFDDSVTVRYETTSGEIKEEILTSSNLYDFWVGMYTKRFGQSVT